MRIAYVQKRSLAILLMTFLIVLSAMPAISLARTEARYELISGCSIFGNDLGATTSKQTLFHQQTLSTADLESLDINFPAFDSLYAGNVNNVLALGPTEVRGDDFTASANILPFGLVSLAFPSISQTVSRSYSASATGYYTATFLGIPPLNSGGSPVTAGYGAAYSPVAAADTLVGSDMMFPEMDNIIPGYDRTKATSTKAGSGKSNNTGTGSSSASGNPTGSATSGTNASAENGSMSGWLTSRSIQLPSEFGNTTIKAQLSNQTDGQYESISSQEILGVESAVPPGYTGQNVDGQNLSYPYFNFKANTGTISNASLLDRMWRNSHLGTMGRAYEGDTSYPDWILPTEYTKSGIAMANWYEVNDLALNQTEPGTQLMPRFWSLGIASPNNIGSGTIGPKKTANSNNRSASKAQAGTNRTAGSQTASNSSRLIRLPSISDGKGKAAVGTTIFDLPVAPAKFALIAGTK